ncbi:hypothetical protein C0J52_25420 [Blattella germanica]|nr:hypothetical protein C0J52_25420 [Blattella germanica]
MKYKRTSTDNNRGGDGDIESTACSSKSDPSSAACEREIPVISASAFSDGTISLLTSIHMVKHLDRSGNIGNRVQKLELAAIKLFKVYFVNCTSTKIIKIKLTEGHLSLLKYS